METIEILLQITPDGTYEIRIIDEHGNVSPFFYTFRPNESISEIHTLLRNDIAAFNETFHFVPAYASPND